MRDLFDLPPPTDPTEAAKQAVRPRLRRRFYTRVGTAPASEGFAVELDGKPIRTPGRALLAAPRPELAAAIAAEWEQQRDMIDPTRMPLTRLANAIIDGVANSAAAVAAEIEQYLASDLLFYRAGTPAELRARQARSWDPILAWARETLGADFATAEGVVHVRQPSAALAAGRAALPADPWRLGALHSITTLTGSALLALAVARGRLSAADAWQAAHVDEDWNMEQWGRDAIALERRAFRFAELEAAATVLAHTAASG